MNDLLELDNLFRLLMPIVLPTIHGFDYLLFLSIEFIRVSKQKQSWIERVGIGLTMIVRIILWFVLLIAQVAIFQIVRRDGFF